MFAVRNPNPRANMNQIFVLYSLKSTSVSDAMNLRDISAELLIEEERFFVESLAIKRMRELLLACDYTETPKRFTIMKCCENTSKLRELIIRTVRDCIEELGCPTFIKTVIEATTLDKYIEAIKKPTWESQSRIRVIVQPTGGEMRPKNHQDVFKEQLTFLLGDQFEIQVLRAPMATDEGLIIL